MKRKNVIYLVISGLLMLVSCQKIDFSEESQTKCQLTVATRATEGATIQYPIVAYAFDADGKCQAQQTISSASESLSMPLVAGTYQIVALSGTTGCTLPSSPRLTSLITFAQTISEPLLMGRATVNLSHTSSKVYIEFGHTMSSLQFNLKDLPSDVTAVSITISDVNTQCNFSGEGATPATVTIPLTQSGSDWQCALAYIFPTSKKTIITVNLTQPSSTTSYSYTYASAFRAGIPYTLNGTFLDDQLFLSGEFVTAEWGEPVIINFNFGPGATQQEISGDFPTAGSIWQDHLVALVDVVSETQANLVLLSLQEWDELPSALNTSNPTAAADIAAEYTEDDQSGWSIPTSDQAKALRDAYTGTALSSFNYVISAAGGTAISDTDGTGTNVRYLCDDANSSFAFVAGTTIAAGGKSSKNYHLRLVKTVTLTK